MANMPDKNTRIARCRFRAWHRGTREADYMIGGFFDKYHADWDEAELALFEALLDEIDVDIMAWALGVQPTPPAYAGPMMDRMRVIDYVKV